MGSQQARPDTPTNLRSLRSLRLLRSLRSVPPRNHQSPSVAADDGAEGPETRGDEQNVESKQELSPEGGAFEIGRGEVEQLRGPARPGDHDRDDDRVEQRRQQRVA